MKTLFVTFAVTLLLFSGSAFAHDSADDLQEDICHEWEKAAGVDYTGYESERVQEMEAKNVAEWKGPAEARDILCRESHEWCYVLTLCDRYHKRFKRWPERCCGRAKHLVVP